MPLLFSKKTRVVFILLFICARTAFASYFFADFEAVNGWEKQELTSDSEPLRLLQGQAALTTAVEHYSQQILQLAPGTTPSVVYLDASHLIGSPIIYCEILVRPVAVTHGNEEEFIDFGGAILGFFRVNQQGELRALHAKSATENVWISTGLRFDLDENGAAQSWIRVQLQLDPAQQRWNLVVNDHLVFNSLRAVSLPSDSLLPLFLFGHHQGITRFDDILISQLPPAELEKQISRKNTSQLLQASVSTSQIVTQIKSTAELRGQKNQWLKIAPKSPAPDVLGWRITLTSNGRQQERHIDLSNSEQPGSDVPKILAYSVGYEDDGKPRPVVLTINADVALTPGVDLSRLRWQLAELKGWPNSIGDIAAQGNFATGLEQKHVLSGEWTRKATLVRVWVED